MIIQAEVSLYPLAETEYGDRIDNFIENLQNAGLEIEVGNMSSVITGECSDVFRVIGEIFEMDAEIGPTVLTLKASNACPSG